MSIRNALSRLGLELPPAPEPAGSYVPAKRVGDLVFVAGQLPMREGKLIATGKVPSACSIEQAQEGARQCVLNALAAVKSLDVNLDRLAGVVRVGVFVCSEDGFTEQPKVANGASDLLVELLGPTGQHVRAAVGTNVLPLGAAVEVEFVFAVMADP
ncbi:RidA family protein [Humisphaera borealis]|uniref:RidA family protein n=1 Tax=Humisphaera borealis TaxID=2807512 RepID=A0A7M2X304_9BACT|nr:RidA family protein [Humisphaera borealis]QOV91140.1 RidA family protein [Humisphaera borealis]